MPKGQQYERDLCRKLSVWWSNNTNDSVFWRTSNSGGRATVREKVGKKTKGCYGDIGAVDMSGLPLTDTLILELKRGYNKSSVGEILDRSNKTKPSQYEEWFTKAEENRKAAGVFSWVLIHKRDRREEMIYFPRRLYQEFCLVIEVNWSRYVGLYCNDVDIRGVLLDEFLATVKPDVIRNLASNFASGKLK